MAVLDRARPDAGTRRFLPGISKATRDRMVRMRFLYLLLAVPVVHWAIFHYAPMYGLLVAFKDYNMKHGVFGSPWNDFAHFQFLFTSPGFHRVMRNTFIISFLKLAFGFTASIVFALLIDQLMSLPFKRTMQSISYLPHFISWVVLGGLIKQLLSPSLGVIGVLIANMTGESLSLLTDRVGFLAILVASSVWQGVGWSAIIYLAVLAGVDQSLYEAAEVDGASRLQKALRISLPALYPLMTIILILRMGQILDAGFDQVFNLYNPLVYDVADVIDTYLYRVGLVELKYDYAAAVGLFRNVVGLVLVISANYLARRYTEYGLW